MSEETKTNTEQTASRRPEGGDNRRGGEGDNRRGGGEGGDRRGGDRRRGGGRKFQRRRKFCKFCADTSMQIDHKNPDLLGQFITERSKILPSRVTGTCSKHQRQLTAAIKRARVLALVSFTPLHHD